MNNIDGETSELEADIIRQYVLTQANAHPTANAIEIGTFRGTTTHLIAAAAPAWKVITVDLPPGTLPEGSYSPADMKYFNQPKEHQLPNIEQVYCDTVDLDKHIHGAMFQLAFIDGAHSGDYVQNDFRKILPMMQSGGIILFHDYNSPHWPEVTPMIDRLARENHPTKWIHHIGTTLAGYIVP